MYMNENHSQKVSRLFATKVCIELSHGLFDAQDSRRYRQNRGLRQQLKQRSCFGSEMKRPTALLHIAGGFEER